MKFFLFSATVFLSVPVTLLGQKNVAWTTNSVFETQEQYVEFMGSFKRASADNPELARMLPLINDVVLGQSLGMSSQKFQSEPTIVDLLGDENVRKEIEMVENQYASLQSANSAIARRFAEQIRNMDFSNADDVVEKIRTMQASATKELEDTLLPHQLMRLRQIAAQSQLRFRSLGQLLTSEPLKSELEISQKQAAEILNEENEIEMQLQKDIAELKRKAREKLIGKLKPTQQKKVRESFGDFIDLQNQSDKSKVQKNKKPSKQPEKR